jgi:uncharacterized Zn finger protein (UPF0148 family)
MSAAPGAPEPGPGGGGVVARLCPKCGGPLPAFDASGRTVCPYCGTPVEDTSARLMAQVHTMQVEVMRGVEERQAAAQAAARERTRQALRSGLAQITPLLASSTESLHAKEAQLSAAQAALASERQKTPRFLHADRVRQMESALELVQVQLQQAKITIATLSAQAEKLRDQLEALGSPRTDPKGSAE